MAQVKIYGLKNSIDANRNRLSTAIHRAIVEALNYPPEKRFQRFFGLEPPDFFFPADRSPAYTIIEISMFEGRAAETKKSLIRALFNNIEEECGISAHDVEITISETPKENWGIRGKTGDELALNYKVDV